MTSRFALVAVLVCCAGAFPFDADAAGRARVAGARANPEGGVTAGRASATRGPNGGAAARGAVVTTDGSGNAQGASGGAVRGPNGAAAARGGSFSRSADGSASRQGGFAASGAAGTVQSSGGVTRDADGNVNGSRETEATAASGASYDGSTTVSNGDVQRTATCTNAAGEVVPCR